jgi:hypothetical protein
MRTMAKEDKAVATNFPDIRRGDNNINSNNNINYNRGSNGIEAVRAPTPAYQ